MRWLLVILTLTLAACSDRTAAPIVPEALAIGSKRTVFVGTTRMEDDNNTFGILRSNELRLLELDVSIPPQRMVGTISDGQEKPDPKIDFVIANRKDIGSDADFQNRIRRSLANKPTDQQEVVVFIHGYNNSFADATFRTAQLAEDLNLPGVSIAYSWPSRGHVLGYEYDNDSALFARDGLQKLLENIRSSGARRIVVVAHSLGSNLTMEALRQIELSSPGWSSRNLSGVILFSPDINVDVFRSQTSAFKELPQPFLIFSSQSDKILRISARLRWEKERLGTLLDISSFDDLPIDFVDVTAFEDGGVGNHFVGGSSPTLLSILKSGNRLDDGFLQGKSNVTVGLPGRRRVLRNATQIILAPGGCLLYTSPSPRDRG